MGTAIAMVTGILLLFAAVTLAIFLLSIVESAVTRMTRLSLRVLAERHTEPRYRLLEAISKDRRHFLMPLQFGNQVLLILTAVIGTLWLIGFDYSYPALTSTCIMLVIVVFFRQLFPRLLTHNNPDRVLLMVLPWFSGFYFFLYWISFPLVAVLRRFVSTETELRARNGNGEEEASDEEIQAYLGVGEEEGIFERAESRLIQSALEFGNTLAKEIMTPRNEIVAIEENATLAELRDLIVSSKHSRIPVYRQRIDQIVGIVYVRNLLGALDPGQEEESIRSLISEALLVPETKNVSALLKEMQAQAEHMAIVINEYGAVSGLVTIEDLLEEIVGEIRDEDELQRIDLLYEGSGNYIVRGGVEIEDLEEAMGIDLGDPDVTTVSGLVVGHLGRVPVPGERIAMKDIAVEVLSSDRKRIHTMRVRLATPSLVSEDESDITATPQPKR